MSKLTQNNPLSTPNGASITQSTSKNTDTNASAAHGEHHASCNNTTYDKNSSTASGAFVNKTTPRATGAFANKKSTHKSTKKRVIVGMSGGVDSSLAAALLVEQGYDVLGVYMRNWTQDLPGFSCPWARDLADAERVAVQLGIDLEVWDYEEQYKREVVNYLLNSYKRGFTPNPDVICNEKVKFGTFANAAFERGADYISTGHYARCNARGQLFRARDEHKDQTYFLWRVPAKMLKRTIFPLGEFESKAAVRQEAQKRSIETANKPDSVGVCFIGPISMRDFLLSQFGKKLGPVIDINTGQQLGEHDGAFLFTLGQRKGLDLGGGPARWIVRVDTQKNIIYVSDQKNDPHLFTSKIVLQDCCWVEEDFLECGCGCEQLGGVDGERHAGLGNKGDAGGERPAGLDRAGSADGEHLTDNEHFVNKGTNGQVIDCLVRTRHTRALEKGHLHISTNDPKNATLIFDKTVQAVAPGQAVSLYQETRCLGGGFAGQTPVD